MFIVRLTRSGLVLGGMLLAAAGCQAPADETPAVAGSAPAPPVSPAVSGPSAQTELVAALRKSAAATFSFRVRGDYYTNKIDASGAYDPRSNRITVRRTISGGDNSRDERILAGSQIFWRKRPGDDWIRIEVKRLTDNSSLLVDLRDRTGLAFFAQRVSEGSVSRTGPRGYRGTFDAQQVGFTPSLPIGAPSLQSQGKIEWPASFTATTDATGRVTSVSVVLGTGNDRRMRLTTTFTGYGKPVKITTPAASSAADPVIYKR
jgi:hypothetical protein